MSVCDIVDVYSSYFLTPLFLSLQSKFQIYLVLELVENLVPVILTVGGVLADITLRCWIGLAPLV